MSAISMIKTGMSKWRSHLITPGASVLYVGVVALKISRGVFHNVYLSSILIWLRQRYYDLLRLLRARSLIFHDAFWAFSCLTSPLVGSRSHCSISRIFSIRITQHTRTPTYTSSLIAYLSTLYFIPVHCIASQPSYWMTIHHAI